MGYGISAKFWIKSKNKHFLGNGRIQLLENIDRLGSIAKAAKVMKMSYKAAWDAIKEMNNISGTPLIETVTGGEGGGGSRITEKAKKLIKFYKKIDNIFSDVLSENTLNGIDFNVISNKHNVKLRTKNKLLAKIVSIAQGSTNNEITLEISDGSLITAIITKEICKNINLKLNDEVYAVFNASNVKLERIK